MAVVIYKSQLKRNRIDWIIYFYESQFPNFCRFIFLSSKANVATHSRRCIQNASKNWQSRQDHLAFYYFIIYFEINTKLQMKHLLSWSKHHPGIGATERCAYFFNINCISTFGLQTELNLWMYLFIYLFDL